MVEADEMVHVRVRDHRVTDAHQLPCGHVLDRRQVEKHRLSLVRQVDPHPGISRERMEEGGMKEGAHPAAPVRRDGA